jgi:hypothetical protein
LNSTEFGEIKPTKLYSHNIDVDKINQVEYAKLIEKGAKKQIYQIKYHCLSKDKEKTKKWAKNMDVPDSIELCEGAQIVVLANLDQDKGIVNGTRGVIEILTAKEINIKLVNKQTYKIPYHKCTHAETEEIGVSYIPLKLAYALTIHKSQGMTLDAVEIDIGSNIFAAGQAYTALSRAQNLNSVKIKEVNKNSFIVNQDVLKLYKDIEDDIKNKTEKYVKKVINNMVYRIANHIELEKSLNFLQDHFVLEDDDKTFEYFDTFELNIIKIGTNEYNTLVEMVNNCKELMIQDIEYLNQQLEDFQIKLE